MVTYLLHNSIFNNKNEFKIGKCINIFVIILNFKYIYEKVSSLRWVAIYGNNTSNFFIEGNHSLVIVTKD